MNNSNELSTRSTQSLPDEYKKAIEEFGAQYALFLNKYPTLQKRISSVPTVYDSVKNGGLSFVEIDKYFKDGASEWWIKTMVIDLFMVLGAFDATTPYQFKAYVSEVDGYSTAHAALQELMRLESFEPVPVDVVEIRMLIEGFNSLLCS